MIKSVCDHVQNVLYFDLFMSVLFGKFIKIGLNRQLISMSVI